MIENKNQKTIARATWADACRLIAMFGVIVIHVSAPIFSAFHTIPLDVFLTANAFDSFARVSVPLFAMLSGALLLGHKNTVWEWRRILKVTLPLIIWSFIYVFWMNYWTGASFNFFATLRGLLIAPAMYHLWFVYMIIGVYLILPFLRVIAVTLIANQRLALYFFVLWFVINSITVYFPTRFIQQLYLLHFLDWPGYFILGYYLTQTEWLLDIPKWISALVYFLASLCTFYLTWHFNASSPTPIETAYDFFSPNVLIASSAAFLWLRQFHPPFFFAKLLAFLSDKLFSVYFIHLLTIEMLSNGFLGFAFTPYLIHPVLGILILSVATLIVSITVVILIRLIPYSAKIL